MAEVDPLIFRILADSKAARKDVADFQRLTGQGLNRVERDVLRLESQIKRSSGAIGANLKGLAASLAAGFSIRQIQQLADGYTRFQNSLKVTGLESERLADTQNKLFGIAQKYGVELESVGSLYGRTAQSQDALGASTADLINVSEAVSASLKVLPADAGAVSGALTQLGQAFASPRVQAEEFNSIVDVLTPLMQEAAKHIEGTGGTLAGLKQKLKDVKGEGVSNVELFRAITASLAAMQEQAAKADQTIGASLTKLNNALGLYIGQTDDGLSATERMAGAIELLADNIDVVANSLAVLTGIVGGRFLIGLVATQGALTGTAATMGAVGAASFALQARAAGAATSMEALTFAARGFAATGIGLVVTAAAVGIGYLAAENSRAEAAAGDLSASIAAQAAEFGTLIQRQRESNAETGNLDATQSRAISSTAGLTGEAHLLANAWARVAAEAKRAAIEQARAAREQALTNLTGAKAAFDAKRESTFQKVAIRPFAERGLGANAPAVNSREALRASDRAVVGSKEYSDLVQATATLNALNGRVQTLEKQTLDKFRPAPATGGGGKPSGGRKPAGGGGASGPSANEIQTRFEQEFDSIAQQILSAQQSTALSVKQRADLERQSVDLAQNMALDSLAADKDYKEGQKELLAQQLKKLGDAERARIAFNEMAQTEQQAADLAQTRHDIAADALRIQYDLATTDDDRRRIALRILDAEDAYLRSKLQAVINSNVALEADKKRAQLDLTALDQTAGARRKLVERQNQSPLDAYIEQTGDTKTRVEQAIVGQLREVNDGITDALTSQLGIKSQFVKDIFSIFIDNVIMRPLAEALRSQQGSGGGFLGSLFNIGLSLLGSGGGLSTANSGSSIKAGFKTPGARAGGGPVAAGSLYRINEAGTEYFQPANSGNIIPLGEMNRRVSNAPAAAQSPIELRIYADEGAFVSRVEAISGNVSVQSIVMAAPALTQRAVSETTRQMSRPRMPGAGR
jgi:tape measure domain-containing protein